MRGYFVAERAMGRRIVGRRLCSLPSVHSAAKRGVGRGVGRGLDSVVEQHKQQLWRNHFKKSIELHAHATRHIALQKAVPAVSLLLRCPERRPLSPPPTLSTVRPCRASPPHNASPYSPASRFSSAEASPRPLTRRSPRPSASLRAACWWGARGVRTRRARRW